MRLVSHLLVVLLIGCGNAAGEAPDAAAGADSATSSTDGAVAAGDLPLGLNDVSVLFPISAGAHQHLLTASATGQRGVLLPESVFEVLSSGHSYSLLRVVAVRFDHCAPIDEDGGCKPQLRLVLGEHFDAAQGFEDMGVHTSYDLTEPELAAIVDDILALRIAHGGPAVDAPLGVHSGMAAEGGDGPISEAYRDLILANAGVDNLVRVTFMSFAPDGGGRGWDFGVFDVVDGQAIEADVPTADDVQQQRVEVAQVGAELVLDPVLDGEEPLAPSFSPQALAAASASERQDALDHTFQLEHPAETHFHNSSCVGCHIATQARDALITEGGLDASGNPHAYQSSLDLSLINSTTLPQQLDRFQPMRAFGYNGNDVVFTQRVVNETAEVVDWVAATWAAQAE